MSVTATKCYSGTGMRAVPRGPITTARWDPYSVILTSALPQFLAADFGFYVKGATLGNHVWWDADGDGLQDAASPAWRTFRYR